MKTSGPLPTTRIQIPFYIPITSYCISTADSLLPGLPGSAMAFRRRNVFLKSLGSMEREQWVLGS